MILKRLLNIILFITLLQYCYSNDVAYYNGTFSTNSMPVSYKMYSTSPYETSNWKGNLCEIGSGNIENNGAYSPRRVSPLLPNDPYLTPIGDGTLFLLILCLFVVVYKWTNRFRPHLTS